MPVTTTVIKSRHDWSENSVEVFPWKEGKDVSLTVRDPALGQSACVDLDQAGIQALVAALQPLVTQPEPTTVRDLPVGATFRYAPDSPLFRKVRHADDPGDRGYRYDYEWVNGAGGCYFQDNHEAFDVTLPEPEPGVSVSGNSVYIGAALHGRYYDNHVNPFAAAYNGTGNGANDPEDALGHDRKDRLDYCTREQGINFIFDRLVLGGYLTEAQAAPHRPEIKRTYLRDVKVGQEFRIVGEKSVYRAVYSLTEGVRYLCEDQVYTLEAWQNAEVQILNP